MNLPLTYMVGATLASCVLSSSVEGQWSVGAEVGADRFWGGSIENTEDERSFHPYRPTTLGAHVQWERHNLGVGIRLGYMSAGLALEGADAAVVAKNVFSVYSMAPEVLYRVAIVGPANRLLLRAGPLLELWKAFHEEPETRLGVQGRLALHVPLGLKLEGVLSAGAALMPSPFAKGQLEPPFERRALWRRSLTAGLQYRL
jgi:hypothetical protein